MAFSFTPQQQQPQQSLFNSPFQQQQQSSNPFQVQQQQQSNPFQFQPQQQQQQQQQLQLQQQQQQQQQLQLQQQQQQQQNQQSQQPQLYLFTNDKAPATYSTKWADLHPDSQKVLLQIEERILEYKDESHRLDQCSRLYDSSVSNNGFEVDAIYVIQELGGISAAMERQKATLQELMSVVKDMLRNTEVAVRSFMILRPRFLHQNKGAAANITAPSSQPSTTIAPTSSNQPVANSIVPIVDFYSGKPKKPSPFMQQTVARFEKYLGECRQWIEELEQLLLDAEKNSLNSISSLLQALPKVMSNVHDFFVHVAAKVESIHQYIESMKTAYLADQRRRGDGDDPFLEADRRETARQEAAARRVHPTIHLPAVSQPTGQLVNASSSSSPMASTAPAMPAPASASSGSGLSLFSTPSAPASSPSLFSTPITSSSAPSSLFGTTGAAQPSPFASLSASTSGFGVSTPLFGSTPASGVSTFSTPFATGAAAGSGASFGTLAKNRGKSRTGRR